MSSCVICFADATAESDVWRCDTCAARVCWGCVVRWWNVGVGCPHCRACDFERVLRVVGGIDVERLTTTALRARTLQVLIVALLLRRKSGAGDARDGDE